ncbi:hypothetical protein GOC74_00235 [Halomicrobium mukohataei]|uniref:Uncharacterized protein n=1 Tax=Halomicrobium mukohataei TaxID=57705 RepID=A0A847UBA3_9EURY|nr:hypothetical protein [Halomicrobium mukohataei]NLV08368.1 hypothetical protein [Halomicrobium mukohataei]
MKETIAFEQAPPVMAWLTILAENEWQITSHTENEMRARREIGASEIPTRLATTWYAQVTENGANGVEVTIEVPAFADSRYATRRVRGRIKDWSEAVDGECRTDAELDVDILGALRNGEE